LCDDAQEILSVFARQHGHIVENVDIAGDNGLLARYGQRIPVVMVGETVVSEFDVDLARLQRCLERAEQETVQREVKR